MSKKEVYISTDGSFSPGNNVGGWAYWIEVDGKKTRRSGTIDPVYASIECELIAIQKGLAMVEKLVGRSKLKSLCVQTDCAMAVEEIRNPKYPIGVEIKITIRRMSLVAGVLCRLQVVEGHSTKKGFIFDKNRWCHKKSKLRMRESLLNKNKNVRKKSNSEAQNSI